MDFKTYLNLSEKTTSKECFSDHIDPVAIRSGILSSIESARFLDKLKKGIFYGKVADDIHVRPEQEEVRLTPHQSDLLHAAFGLVTEANEVLESVFNHIFVDGTELDSVNLLEESGDVLWYLALLFRTEGLSLEDVLERNIRKLEKRYGGSFTPDRALDRDLEAERGILEN